MSGAIAVFAGCVVLALGASSISVDKPNDGQIRQKIIQESIDQYPGNCPCPYNRARNGSRCGGRSAYNRAGGYAPLCYASDVTPTMIREYRNRR